jgi:hypothetical protein
MNGESFKLIKTYPGSEKLGTVWTWDEDMNLFKTKDRRFSTVWTREYFISGIGEYFIMGVEE